MELANGSAKVLEPSAQDSVEVEVELGKASSGSPKVARSLSTAFFASGMFVAFKVRAYGR